MFKIKKNIWSETSNNRNLEIQIEETILSEDKILEIKQINDFIQY